MPVHVSLSSFLCSGFFLFIDIRGLACQVLFYIHLGDFQKELQVFGLLQKGQRKSKSKLSTKFSIKDNCLKIKC